MNQIKRLYQTLAVMAFSLTLASLYSAPAGAQEWTRFRGPNGTGISTAATVPIAFTASDYNWRTELPGIGHSSPVLWGKKIFVTGAEKDKRHLLCLNAADGKILWKRSYPFQPYHTHELNTPASSTPTVDAQRVYITWPAPDSFLVLALDHDGKEVWRRDLGAYPTQHGGAGSPILFGETLILSKEPEDAPGALYGLNTKTGAVRWKRDRNTQPAVYSTPFVNQPKGGKPEIIFTSTAHGVTSLDPETGAFNWEKNDLFKMRCVGSPILAGETIFATTGQGGGDRLAFAIRPGVKGSAAQPAVAYQMRRGSSYVPTPIVVGNNLFCWGDGGIVTCFRADTGTQVWSERAGGNFYGSPVCINGKLYAINTKGELFVIEASNSFKLLAKNDLGEASHATPAVADGVLYLRTFSHLISVGGKKK